MKKRVSKNEQVISKMLHEIEYLYNFSNLGGFKIKKPIYFLEWLLIFVGS